MWGRTAGSPLCQPKGEHSYGRRCADRERAGDHCGSSQAMGRGAGRKSAPGQSPTRFHDRGAPPSAELRGKRTSLYRKTNIPRVYFPAFKSTRDASQFHAGGIGKKFNLSVPKPTGGGRLGIPGDGGSHSPSNQISYRRTNKRRLSDRRDGDALRARATQRHFSFL